MTQPQDKLAVLSDIIRQRRSIKPVDMDASRTVDRSLLIELLENANWAPTHGLTEPWRFHVYQGAAREDLSETMQRIYRETTPAAEFREDKLRKMSENPLRAPVVLVVWMERRGGAKIPELEEIEATACAMQNLHLTASAAGLAGYWSTPPLIDTPQFAQWLSIRPEDRCLGLFYLGWPKADFRWPQGTRHPVAEKIRWLGEPA
jgi:nitroreductase